MAQLTLTSPDAALPRVVDALCAHGGWTAESGVARPQFARQHVAAYVKRVVRDHEDRTARDAAGETAAAKADAEVSVS